MTVWYCLLGRDSLEGKLKKTNNPEVLLRISDFWTDSCGETRLVCFVLAVFIWHGHIHIIILHFLFFCFQFVSSSPLSAGRVLIENSMIVLETLSENNLFKISSLGNFMKQLHGLLLL